MDKILTAKEILEKKGYVGPKFDMDACIRAISEWFQENDVVYQLMLVPFRFVGFEEKYPHGFADASEALGLLVNNMTDISTILNPGDTPFIIDKDNIENVVKVLTDTYGYVVERNRKGMYLVSLL